MSSSPSDWAARSASRVGALAAAALAGACVSGPLRTLRSGIERTDAGTSTLESQTNLVELAVQDRLGPDFEYRLNENFVQSSQEISSPSGDSSGSATTSRSTADFVMSSGPLSWTQLYQREEDRSLLDGSADNRLVRTDLMQKLEWLPLDLPQITGWIDYRTVEDRFFVDQRSVEAQLQVHQSFERFDYDYSYRDRRIEDVDSGVETDSTEHIVRGTYHDTYHDGRVSTTLGVFADERRNAQHVPAGGAAAVQVFPSLAWSDVDFTPQISALTSNPALVDGNVAASTGVDIGGFASGGQLSWNLAVELPPGASIDVVRLKTVAVVPATFVNQFAFSVWASDDNTFWTLVKSSAAFVYDPAFLHFRLSIPTVSRRYLKVVNTASPGAAPAVLVSEMELFRSAGGGGSTTLSNDESLQSATGNLSWRVGETLTLGYDLFAQQADADSDGGVTRDETRIDNGIWAAWTPHEQVDANVRVAQQRIQDPVLRDEELRTLISVVSYRPLRTLDFDLSYTGLNRSIDGADDLDTQVVQLLATAELLRTLRAELAVERSQQEDFTNQRDIGHTIASAALIAQLTRIVELTLRARNDAASVDGAGAAGIPDPSEERYEFDVVVRPSEQLIAEAEFLWIDSYAGAGLDQRLRVDWIPFPDGAVDLQFDYDRTSTQSYTDNSLDRYRARTRYTLSSRTYLEFQYAAEVPDSGATIEVFTFAFSFTN